VESLTATEAARRFSELLDAVEARGETFLVARRGRTVARIAPAAAASGKDLKDLLRKTRPDPGWQRELRELRSALTVEDRAWNA
jgi:prevent-host-death family protein